MLGFGVRMVALPSRRLLLEILLEPLPQISADKGGEEQDVIAKGLNDLVAHCRTERAPLCCPYVCFA
jgi:hypothetical protein